MSRSILAIMAGLLCALAGIRHAAALRGEAARLTRWTALLRRLCLLLQEGVLPIPEALLSAADDTQAPDQLLRTLARELQRSPMKTLAQSYARHGSAQAEQPILQRMFLRLGQGSRELRSLAVEQAAQELHLLAEAARERSSKDAKMWQTLGFIAGACLTLMLL